MGCCSEKRARWSKSVASPSTVAAAAKAVGPVAREFPLTRTVGFEYVGETALSVLGPITRIHYRFGATGARVEVEHRDAPYVSGVPNLRRVRNTLPSRSQLGVVS